MKLLQALLACFCAFYGVSCVGFVDQAVAANGNKETIGFLSLGGTSTLTGANGAHFTHDHQQSLRDVVTAAGTAYSAAKAAQSVRDSANATTTQQANQQASALAIQQDQEAAAAASAAAAAKNAAQTTARATGVPALVKP